MPESARTPESLDRIEKLAEWRGKVSNTLETISKALTELDQHQAIYEREQRSELQALRDCFNSKLGEIEKDLKKELQDVIAAVKEADKRLTRLYIKVAGIGATVSLLMWLVMNVLVKKVIGL